MIGQLVHLDYETASEVDIGVGTYNYATHPSTRVLMASYAFDDEDVQQWFPHLGPMPQRLRDALANQLVTVCAHNAKFERAITRHVLRIDVPLERWLCTQAMAASCGLALDLETVCEILRLPDELRKMKEGAKLIHVFCKPRTPTKNKPWTWSNWTNEPEKWAVFCSYGRLDVVAERRVYKILKGYLTDLPRMRELWCMGERINERGVPVDLEMVRGALEIAEKTKRLAQEEMRALTGLANPNSPSQLLAWARAQGYPNNNLRKSKVELAIADEENGMTKVCRDVLNLRLASAKTSNSKYERLLEATAPDGRVRYMFEFRAASRTGRYGGRVVQMQNLPRPAKYLEKFLAECKQMIRERDYEGIKAIFDDPLVVLSSSIRSAITAPKGRVLTVADLSAIELCVLAWLTKCKFWLDVLKQGLDPYKAFGVHFLRKPYDEITKPERNLCKPGALGAGYRLGGGFPTVDKNGDPAKTGLWSYAEMMGITMTRPQAAEAVRVYREISPEVVQAWYALEEACFETIKDRQPRKVLGLVIDVRAPFLRIRLPSGRYLHYCRPKIQNRTFQVGVDEDDKPVYKTALNLTYEGQDQQTKQWVRQATHGGKLMENIVQAIALDVLNHGMQKAIGQGFDVILHVHDEVGTERDIDDEAHNLEALCACLTSQPEWAPDLPLGAAGYDAPFYRKD